MSRHLVKEGITIGWKEDPTEEDYILTYESPNILGWKQGPEERTVLTKDGEFVGWRNITPKETFPGEVMTTQSVSGQTVNYGWGNLPSANNVLVAEGFGNSWVWDPTSETLRYGTNVSQAKFGVDAHLEIEFIVGDGPHPEMIYKGDIPAGTEVTVTGHQLDNLFHIVVSGPGVSLNHNHFYEGIIEVRATTVTLPTYNITQGGTATSYWILGKTTYQESTSSQSFNINYNRTGWQINSVTITRLGTYGGPSPTVSGTSPTSRTVTIPAGSYGDFRVNLSQKEMPTLSTPTIAASAECIISGTFGDPEYTFIISVTNTASVQVTMRVSIDGVWQSATMPGGSTRTFTRSRSTPWNSVTVQAYATADGYKDSETRTVTRSVSCPVPELPKTASPSIVGNPTCIEIFGGDTYLDFTVKNNDSSQVTIRRGSTILGTIPANGTRTFSISYPLPGSYNLSITAQASNKEQSNTVNKSGNILLCRGV